MVKVLPQPQRREYCVATINQAVAIASIYRLVELGES
jgi:hypothetical protein